MNKWLVLDLILMFFVSVVVIFARRQGIKKIEKSKTNPSAYDFEILED
jgi:hypothetical protein